MSCNTTTIDSPTHDSPAARALDDAARSHWAASPVMAAPAGAPRAKRFATAGSHIAGRPPDPTEGTSR